jgi:cob(I)alamin adenosyltransferase
MGAKRGSKGDLVFEAVGTLDELNSQIGVAVTYAVDEEVRRQLLAVQNDIFAIGSHIYFRVSGKDTARFESRRREDLENFISKMSAEFPPLKSFVIPGGSQAAAFLHVARAVARRAERELAKLSGEVSFDPEILAYMNRLSSYLFVAALYSNHKSGIKEQSPKY